MYKSPKMGVMNHVEPNWLRPILIKIGLKSSCFVRIWSMMISSRSEAAQSHWCKLETIQLIHYYHNLMGQPMDLQ